MRQQFKPLDFSDVSSIVMGLFLGRFLSELAPGLTGHSLLGAVIMTVLCLIGSFFVWRRQQLKQTWPLLVLLIYVIYPEPDPLTAVSTLLLVLFIYLLQLDRPLKLMGPLLLTAVTFTTLYIATLSPGVLPADNGEFQVVAANLGVAHPPGFALYTMLAHLMTRLPGLGTAAYKVNLFSALTSILTLLLVYLTTYWLTNKPGAAATAVLTLGTATTFWAQATTANIRSLTSLFAAAMIYTLVRFQETTRDYETRDYKTKNYETRDYETRDYETRDYKTRDYKTRDYETKDYQTRDYKTTRLTTNDHWLILFALALGFGVAHHASLVFIGLVCLIFVLVIDPGLRQTPRRWLRPFLAGLLGLLPLLYFPLRAGADVRGASGGLATIDGFLNHVLARGFRGDLFYYLTPAELWPRFQVMANVLTFQFHPWLLAGMTLGLALLLWRDRKLALLLGGTFALHTFITATYRAPQTVEYMLPAYVPLVIILGYGVGQVGKWASGQVAGGRLAVVFGALMVVTAVYQGWQHYPSFVTLHQDTSTLDYAQGLLQAAPPDSTILADWHWAAPLWYLQEVEGQRPDVSVQYVNPEGESYAANWAAQIGEELANGRSVIATHFDENAYAALPVPEPLGDAFLFRQQPLVALPNGFTPLDLALNDEIHILGYQLNNSKIEIAQETIITIAWEPISNPSASLRTGLQSPVSLFIHLIGYDGQLYAQDDLQIRPQPGINLTQFRLTPRLGAAPGDFSIMLGTPDQAENRLAITTLTVTAMSRPPFTQNRVYRTLPDGRRLVGYDWDNTLNGRSRLYLHWQTKQGYQTEVRDDISPDGFSLPAYFGPWGLTINNQQLTINRQQFYVPLGQGIVWTGQPLNQSPLSSLQSLTLRHTFHSSRPVLHDLVISVRLIGYEADGFHWAWWDLDDWVPALGAIPTLKWIGGTAVHAPHTLQVDPAAQPGQTIGATLRLYDAFTNRPLPILDERITNELQLPWIPLGQTTLE
jgi:hypothetical protein